MCRGRRCSAQEGGRRGERAFPLGDMRPKDALRLRQRQEHVGELVTSVIQCLWSEAMTDIISTAPEADSMVPGALPPNDASQPREGDWLVDSRGGTRTRDPGIMSAVL